jgi:hypothetical protein
MRTLVGRVSWPTPPRISPPMQPLPRGVSTWRSDRPYINPWGAVLSGRLNAIADALDVPVERLFVRAENA